MASLLDASPSGVSLRNALRLMTEYGVFKFGDYMLKSGQHSPIYIDLRECFMHMDLFVAIRESFRKVLVDFAKQKPYDGIVGVPYAALPYATSLAEQLDQKLYIIRKEAKTYGTKKLIEGIYEPGQRVIVVEDVVTSGISLKQVVSILRAEGLVVEDVFCVLDRDQGGKENLADEGITLHSIISLQSALSFLYSVGKVDKDMVSKIVQALDLPFSEVEAIDVNMQFEQVNGQNGHTNGDSKKTPVVRLSLAARERLAGNEFTRKVLSLMKKKQSNVCVAVDFTEKQKILEFVEKAAPFVIAIKLHADCVVDADQDFFAKLKELAANHEFFLFEDRKYADTGATMSLQAAQTADWAHLVTVHGLPGADSIVAAFRPYINDTSKNLSAVVLIAELSTKGALTSEEYSKNVVEIGEANPDVVCGFVCQTRCSDKSGLLHWTPGVNLSKSSDGAGQQWRTIDKAIIEQENDIVIVGRGVTESEKPVAELKKYREVAWEALSSAMPE